MRILLDTHVYLWWCEDSPALSNKARTMIQEAETVHVSSVTIWELAIKIAIGKFEGNLNDLAKNIQASGFIELPIRVAHTIELPGLATFHKDPFDRMLIAQAISEPLQLITHDVTLAKYTPLVVLV
jgi:PIN domain nuclease of toxin-antitoxin system